MGRVWCVGFDDGRSRSEIPCYVLSTCMGCRSRMFYALAEMVLNGIRMCSMSPKTIGSLN